MDLAAGWELGLFRVIWVLPGREETWGAGIGFVLRIWGMGKPAGRQRYGRLGSFRINMGWRDTWYAEIGFVSHFWLLGL